MKKLSKLLLIFIPCIAFATIPDQQLTTLLNNFKTMQADFVQTTGQMQVSGCMALQKPGKFYWQVIKPNKQKIIVDGTHIWLYDEDLQQVTKQVISTKQTDNPAMLLMAKSTNVIKNFTVTFADNWFTLKPKQTNSSLQQVKLYFVNKKLRKMQVTDNLGQQSTFTFSNIKMNIALSADLFQFTPPKGVDVITSN